MRATRSGAALLVALPFLLSIPSSTEVTDSAAGRVPSALSERLARKAARAHAPQTKPAEAAEYYLRQRLPLGGENLPMDHLRAMLDDVRAREATQAASRGSQPGDIQGWSSIGPGNIGGRTREILIDPNDPDIMYAAGVAGGIFKSTNAGVSWAPTDDFMLNLAVASMVMDPTDSSVIYAGTGEGFGNSIFVRGLGIFKTTDAGTTWAQLPSTDPAVAGGAFFWVNELVISPNDSQTIYAGTQYGVYKSTNAGTSWQVKLRNPWYVGGVPASNGCSLGCLDVAVRPDRNPDVVWAAFGSSSKDGLFRSDDGGATWIEYTTPSYQGRMEIAIAPSDGNRVYLCMADNGGLAQWGRLAGLWRADDGETFSLSVDLGHPFGPWLLSYVSIATGCLTGYPIYSQGWYDQVIAVDPVDPDVLFLGGIDVYRSDDAGVTFGLMGYYFYPDEPNYLHPDQHAMTFHPDYDGVTNQTLFVGNDGGIYRTQNARAATSQEECPTSPNPGPPPDVVWDEMMSGYTVTQFYHGDSGWESPMFVGGTQDNGSNRALSTVTPDSWTMIYGGDGGSVAIDPNDSQTLYVEIQGFPTIEKSTDGGATFTSAVNGITDSGGVFIAVFTMDPSDPEVLWTGATRVWRTTDGAANWTLVSGGLPSADVISAIAVAPSDGNVVYLGFDNGYVARSTNALSADPTWTIYSAGLVLGGYVSSVAVDPLDPDVAYATYSNLGVPHVFRTTNGGANWTSIDGISAAGIPDIPVHWIAVRPSNSQQLYAGTEFGVFASETGGTNWVPANGGLAHTVVETLDFIGDHTLVAYTFGRGAFVTSLSNATGAPAVEGPADAGRLHLAAAPNPARSRTTIEADVPRAGYARVAVYDVAGRLVRELHAGPAAAGRLSLAWGATDRAGRRVAAGTYFVRLEQAGEATTRKIVLIR